ncbi:LLM class flavin-dependent oxidoreductase [Streptomyces sp. MP131-18]|uniref:LLM class flavin-dependent oxidoreductase n=1 Tax=Streptomyces sp. MP131-18 TaxID=1857892 RepID=UPI00097C1E34|nr:LLM class flavin-dependent oxidoreductase [Streptomyces sp. MP131-18]ONK15755.1 Alkanesulfonate monooxygenase [Streptomyces sp. MP131-18]
MTAHGAPLSFGIKTTPVGTGYDEILRVWQEADELPEIEHAWLWDHLLPVFGRQDAPVLEGWTLLAALAARTRRLGLGLLVTGNGIRSPAVLAKIAATTDAIARGRLTVGVGVGATLRAGAESPAAAEYPAYGLGLVPHAEGVARLDEACTVLRLLWTRDLVGFHGRHYRPAGAHCEPRPDRHLPLLVGGAGTGALRVAALHADLWNVQGPPHHTIAQVRARVLALDAQCAAVGRDPGEITRSAQLHVSYDDPAATRTAVLGLIDAGISHIVLSLPMPFPPGAARWAAQEIIGPVRAARATRPGPSGPGRAAARTAGTAAGPPPPSR